MKFLILWLNQEALMGTEISAANEQMVLPIVLGYISQIGSKYTSNALKCHDKALKLELPG